MRFAVVSVAGTAVLLIALFLLLQQPTLAASSPDRAITSPLGEPITHTVYLPLITSPAGPCAYLEVNDAVVVEMESVPLVEEWQLETSFPGYTGSGYYVWRGPQYLGEPGHGILTYPLNIVHAATYRLSIRNSHTGSPTDNNDVWVRLDGGPWTKAFSSRVDRWSYFLQFDFQNGQPHDWVDFPNLQPGVHLLDISARSPGFYVDRLIFSSNGMGQLDDWPESPCVVP
jgi:hypothetical protein